jgi:hypothetical protein
VIYTLFDAPGARPFGLQGKVLNEPRRHNPETRERPEIPTPPPPAPLIRTHKASFRTVACVSWPDHFLVVMQGLSSPTHFVNTAFGKVWFVPTLPYPTLFLPYPENLCAVGISRISNRFTVEVSTQLASTDILPFKCVWTPLKVST